MKLEDVRIGLQVIPYRCREDLASIVSEPNENGLVDIKYPSGNIDNVHFSYLEAYDPESERVAILAAQRQLDDCATLFGQAFDKLSEARRAAEKAGLYIRDKDFFQLSKLEQIVENNGWSSSSLWC